MNNIIVRFIVISVICISSVLTVSAQERVRLSISNEEMSLALRGRQWRSQNKESAWIDRSDLVAVVEVVGFEIVNPAKSTGGPDRSNQIGWLITMQVKSVLCHRQEFEANLMEKVYIFQQMMNLADPLVSVGDKGVVFLRKMPLPELVLSNQMTWPKLPPDNYCDYAVLPHLRNSAGPQKAFISEISTNEISAFEKQIRYGLTNNMIGGAAYVSPEPYVKMENSVRGDKRSTNVVYRAKRIDQSAIRASP